MGVEFSSQEERTLFLENGFHDFSLILLFFIVLCLVLFPYSLFCLVAEKAREKLLRG